MPAQEIKFETQIQDHLGGEWYHALITLRKTVPIDVSRRAGTLALAHIFITPVSGQLTAGWESHYSVHNHFILQNLSGQGRYIIRDPMGRNETERACSIWDLGHPFATRVMKSLQELV